MSETSLASALPPAWLVAGELPRIEPGECFSADLAGDTDRGGGECLTPIFGVTRGTDEKRADRAGLWLESCARSFPCGCRVPESAGLELAEVPTPLACC